MRKKWRIRLSLLLCVVLLNSLPGQNNVFALIFETSLYVNAEEGQISGMEAGLLEESSTSEKTVYSYYISGDDDIIDYVGADGTSSASSGPTTADIDWYLNNGHLKITGSGEIPENLYYDLSNVTTMTIGKDITKIGANAFSNPIILEKISFEEGSQLKEIGANAFALNPSILCENKLTVEFPEGLEKIGDHAFYGSNLVSVTIPASVKNIGCAFEYSKKLEEVVFEKGSACEELGIYAFQNCSSLKSITLPNNLKRIGNYAFKDTNLTEITIPASVEFIEPIEYDGQGECCNGSFAFTKNQITFNITCGKLDAPFMWAKWNKDDNYTNGITDTVKATPGTEHIFSVEATDAKGAKIADATCTEKAKYYKSCICGAVSSLDSDIFYAGEVCHDFSIEDTTKKEAKITDATCTEKAKYYKSCICGAVSSLDSDIFYAGEALGHDFSIEDTTKKEAKIADATCTEKAKYHKSCSVCGLVSTDDKDVFTAGEALGHDFSIEDTTKKEAKIADATCTEKAKYHKSCSVCGVVCTDDKNVFTAGEALGHIDKNEDGVCDREGCGYILFVNGFWIDNIPDQTYTGKPIIPQLTVHYKNKEVVQNKDYTVTITDNTDVGTAKVNITGCGSCSGTKSVEFKIIAADFSDAAFTADDIYIRPTGKNQTVEPVLKWKGDIVADSNYTYQYFATDESGNQTGDALSSIKDIGKYVIVLTAKEGGNFAGTKTINVIIIDDSKKLASELKIKTIKAQKYSGSAIEPDIVVKDGNSVLVKDSDYTVRYENNTDAGTAAVIITGKGKYVGTKSVAFKIKGTSLKKAVVQGVPVAVTYTGNEIKFDDIGLYIKATKTTDQISLVEGKDYEITSFTNNTSVGKGIVTITGKGGYSGVIKKTFKIKPFNYAEDNSRIIVDLEENTDYSNSQEKPGVTVKFICEDKSEIILTEKTDYTVKYLKNKKANASSEDENTFKIKIKLKGNYKGVIVKTY